MTDERFNTPQALRQRAKLCSFEHRTRVLERANIESDHAAETLLLTRGKIVLFVRLRSRVVNLQALRMIFKERRDCASRLVVLLHPERQSLGAAQHQPRIERRQD